MIAPTFESLATKFSKPGKITFCKVNTDNQQSIAAAHGVKAMPTFLIFKSGSVIETIQGANPPALTAAVEKAVKLAGNVAPGASFKTPGRTLGGPQTSGGRGARGGWGTLSSRLTPFNILNTILTFFGLYIVSLFSASSRMYGSERITANKIHSLIHSRRQRTQISMCTSQRARLSIEINQVEGRSEAHQEEHQPEHVLRMG